MCFDDAISTFRVPDYLLYDGGNNRLHDFDNVFLGSDRQDSPYGETLSCFLADGHFNHSVLDGSFGLNLMMPRDCMDTFNGFSNIFNEM